MRPESGTQELRWRDAYELCRGLLREMDAWAPGNLECILHRAKHVAGLVRDTAAVRWLSLEASGYPSTFRLAEVGACRVYLEQGHRAKPGEERVTTGSLLDLARAEEGTPANRIARDMYSAIHSYLVNVESEVLLGGDFAPAMERLRIIAVEFLRRECPQAAEELKAACRRAEEGGEPERRQAMASCRGMLEHLAESVYPSRSGVHADRDGTAHSMNSASWKNRLLAFLDDAVEADGKTRAISTATLKYLVDRLDAINDLLSKGVHTILPREECDLALAHSYLVVAEVARVHGVTRRSRGGPAQP